MNVLSLFDGMSCGQIALERCGFKIENYFACEIDKYAIQVTQANYPNTQQLGDVTKVSALNLPTLDLVIGGSPCQGFSFAGKQLNFEDPRSKLFFEFVRLLKEARVKNPNVKFLLENVKMKKEYRDIISEHLGVSEVFIDSSNFSPHNRPRYYWTNLEGLENLPRTKKGSVLSDILEDVAPAALYLSEEQIVRGLLKNYPQKFASGNSCGAVAFPTPLDRKGKSLTVVNIKGSREATHVEDLTGIRILTRLERERLQTVPEGYTSSVSEILAFAMLGNGWTVDVIVHIFQSDISL